MSVLAFVPWLAVAAGPETFPLPPKPALDPLPWVVERDEGLGWLGSSPSTGNWVAYPGLLDRRNPWNHVRKSGIALRVSASVTHDVTLQPWLEIEVPRTTLPWRLYATAGDGPEVLLGDTQLAGSLRVNLATALSVQGPQSIALHIYLSAPGREIDFGARFLASAQPSQADVALGDIATRHGKVLTGAVGLTSKIRGWPRLWWNKENRAAWQQRVNPAATESLAQMMAERTPIIVLDGQRPPDNVPNHGLAIRPMPATPGPRRPGYQTHMRDILWWGFNQWELAALVSDDPEIVAQARRWTLDLADSRFWAQPAWYAFDDAAAHALQSLAQGYDVSHDAMTPDERARTRAAIHAVATELYWNVQVDNGYIENDLRSNHAASALDGLSMAGLVLLGEDPDASRWVALAEQKMLDAFAIHTSGASWESPAYGRYATDEWFRLATTLSNVTGREHRDDPFFRRHADFEVAIADWEGHDLGYNQGGAHQTWNQWVLQGIAAFTHNPEHQWIGGASIGNGYGERFFFLDPALPAEVPKGRNTGAYFADIGVATWRTGWRADDTILLFHDGPRPLTHQDRDAGQLTMYGRGHRFLSDGLGALSEQHNLVSWDNNSQDQYQGGAMSRFFQDPRVGSATGDYQGWRRVVLYLRPDAVVLVDRLDMFNQSPERVARSLFHLTADKVTLEDGTFTAVEGDTALQGTLVLDTGIVPDGHLGDGPSGAKTVAWRFAGAGETRVNGITLLSLSGAKEAGKVAVSRAGNVWTFHTTTEDVKVGIGKGEVVSGVSADGDVWAARVDPTGPRSAVVCGGAHAFIGGTEPASTADCAAVTLP